MTAVCSCNQRLWISFELELKVRNSAGGQLRMSLCAFRDSGLVPDPGNTGKSAWCTSSLQVTYGSSVKLSFTSLHPPRFSVLEASFDSDCLSGVLDVK